MMNIMTLPTIEIQQSPDQTNGTAAVVTESGAWNKEEKSSNRVEPTQKPVRKKRMKM